jgi:hypothetical protein
LRPTQPHAWESFVFSADKLNVERAAGQPLPTSPSIIEVIQQTLCASVEAALGLVSGRAYIHPGMGVQVDWSLVDAETSKSIFDDPAAAHKLAEEEVDDDYDVPINSTSFKRVRHEPLLCVPPLYSSCCVLGWTCM